MLHPLTGRDVPCTAQSVFIEPRVTNTARPGHRLGLATVYRALHLLRDQGRAHG